MSLSTVFASKLPPTAFGQKQVMWPTQRVTDSIINGVDT
jgi:hypothetical protein